MIPAGLLDVALRLKSASGQSYAVRVAQLRAEQELSNLSEEIVSELPLGRRFLGALNPVTRAGAMQMNIDFSARTVHERAYPWPKAKVAHKEVFSRRGGVYFGTEMLLDYPVSYDRMLYRSAGYNAGRYASDSAAFQSVVAKLTGIGLALDGDLLRYTDGEPAGTSRTERAIQAIDGLELDEKAIRRDLRLEKSFDFEQTALYRFVCSLAAERGLPAPTALVPDLRLESPKISRRHTTRWFTDRVEGRYRRCLARG